MRKIAKITENDRKALFHNTAAKMGMTDAIIEKDFWVCYVLDYLFHHSQWKDNIAFKGGTSLSKAYGLIERFSEDIDLILDWRVLRTEISRSPILAGAEPEHYLVHKVRFAMSGNTGDGEHPPRFQPHDFVQIRYSQFHARGISLFKQLVQSLP